MDESGHILCLVPPEKLQRLIGVADERGGSVDVKTAKELVRAPWNLIAERSQVKASDLRMLLEHRYVQTQPDSVKRLLARAMEMAAC